MVDRVAKRYWMNVPAVATPHFPTNGEGGVMTTARIASGAGTTSYTDNMPFTSTRASVTDTAWNPAGAGVVAGDYIVTSGGWYGVVAETPAAGVGATVFVKQWRLPKRLQAAGVITKPTDATAATIYPACIIGDYEHVHIVRISPSTAGTYLIGDQRGTTFDTVIVAAAGIGSTMELGIDVDSPFTVQGGTGSCEVIFEGYN